MIALALLVALAGAPPQAVYVEDRIEAGLSAEALVTVGVRKTWVLADRVRIEDGKRVEIYDAKRGLFRMFDMESRQWTEATRERLAGQGAVPRTAIVGMSLDDALEPRVAESPFVKRSERAKIGAWSAEAWRATEPDPEGGRGTLWIARDAGAAWADLQRVAIALFPGTRDTMARYLREVEALGGWPVRIERTNGERLLRYTVTTIERVPAPDSLFEDVPAGFERVPFP